MKKIETNNKTVLFVEVPEGSKDIYIENDNLYLTSRFMEYKDIITYSELPLGNWQILGKSTELSEEQMETICEVLFEYDAAQLWMNYKYKKPMPVDLTCDTVQESYLSLLEANGIVDRNPFGTLGHAQAWKKAQSKVKTYLILIKK